MTSSNIDIKTNNEALSNNFQNLFHSIPDLLFILNSSAELLEVNKAIINELGYLKEELIGKCIDFLHPEDRREEANEIIGEILEGKRKSCHIPLISKSGVLIPVVTTVSHSNWNGEKALFGVSRPLKRIDFVEEKYAKIFQNTPVLSCIIEMETGHVVEINQAFIDKLGFSPEESIGKWIIDLLKIDIFEKDYIKNRLISEGSISEVEIYITGKNGNKFPVVISSEMISIEGKDHFYVIAFDVSQRKLAQRRNKESEARYRELFKNMDSGFSYHKVIFDKNNNPVDSIFIDVNPKFERLVGLKKKEILNKRVLKVFNLFDKKWMANLQSVVITGEPTTYSVYINELQKHIKIWAYRPRDGYVGVIYTDQTLIKDAELKIKQQSVDIKKVIRSGEQKKGQEYYDNMVLCLSEITKADYTYIGVVQGGMIKTLAISVDGVLGDEFIYDIKDTPCEQVLNKNTKIYKRSLQKSFPKDKLIEELGIEAYVGTPVFDKGGIGLGILVSLYKKVIVDTEFAETLFELFATSIGSEMKRSSDENLLLESRRRYKWLSEATFEGIIMTHNGLVVDVNEQAQSIFGYKLSDLSGGSFKNVVHPDDYYEIVSRIKDQNTQPYVFRGVTKKGKTIYLDVKAKHININNKDYRLSVLRDITQQKIDELKLLEREQLLNTIFDSTPAIMMILDNNTNIERMNRFGYSYLGNEEKEIKGKKCGDILSCIGAVNDYKSKRESEICKKCIIRQATEDTLKTGKEHLKLETDIVISISDNLIIKTFLVSTKLIEPNNKKNILLTLDDITERKQMEEELIESNEALLYSEKRYKLLTDLTFEGIVLHRDGEIININKSFSNMLGYSSNELVGLKFMITLIPKKYQSLVETKLKENYSLPYEIEIYHKNGSMIPVEIEARDFIQNEIKTRVTAVRDISERKLSEERVLNAILETEEKERASFAQELHDGLGPILSNIQMYFQWLAESDENRVFVSQKGNESLKNAFRTLREISGKLSPHILHNFGLGRALSSFIEQVPEKISLCFNVINKTADARYHKSIEITLYRVLTELINNTIKYAQAKNVNIEIKKNDSLNALIIDYMDDGRGIDIEAVNKGVSGFGMKNIQSRIKTLKGNIIYNEDRNSGFNLSIIVPIKKT